MGCNISNTRNSVSLGYQNSKKRVEKYDEQWSIFDEIQGVWIANETLSQVFDIFSQSKQNQKSAWKSKIVKIHAN